MSVQIEGCSLTIACEGAAEGSSASCSRRINVRYVMYDIKIISLPRSVLFPPIFVTFSSSTKGDDQCHDISPTALPCKTLKDLSRFHSYKDT